eukprot:UN09133
MTPPIQFRYYKLFIPNTRISRMTLFEND